MDIDYHIKLVRNESTGYVRTDNDRDLVAQAETMFPAVRQAMLDVVKTGDYATYVKAIEAYDKFVWEQSHKGDKTNIYAYKKIKVSPSWTEQFWAPIFERVRLAISKEWNEDNLVLIQNTEVVEAMNDQGASAFKDVDCGIAVKVAGTKRKNTLMPVVVCESKTGHYCKTSCTGVDAIIRRVRKMNPKVLALAVTDNQVSVGQDHSVDNVFGAGGILVSQRGKNNDKSNYPKLDPSKFEMVEKLCINYLKNHKAESFTKVQAEKTNGVSLRESIDTKGYYVPKELEKFLT